MSTVASQPGALASSAQRAVPMQKRADLHCEFISYQQSGSWVIKDPVTLKYVRLQPEQYKILELLDGKRSLEQLKDAYRREFPAHPLNLEEIQNLVTDLHRSGLVISDRFNQGAPLIERHRENRRKQIWSTIQNILYLRLPGWDPHRVLDLIHPFFKWMFTPIGVFIWAVVVASSWILLAVEFNEFREKMPGFQQFFGWPNLMYMWIILGAAKVIHEFGHGLSCRHFGGECHEMGVMFLVMSPCMYCDVTDSWLMHNKWHRIIIGAAGMYIEVFLAGFAIFGWFFSQPGLFNYLCLNLFFVSTVSTVIFNANPLMRYDGYYMLSDYLEIPNLRPKADKMLSDWFGWYCLGIEARPDPFMPLRGQGWFVLFAIAANIYRWIVMFTILFFFYSFLKPYGLQSLGVALAFGSFVSIFIWIGNGIYKMVKAPRRDPLSKVKITISLLVFVGVITGIMQIPLPWSIEAAFVVEPHGVQNVFTVSPGRLKDVRVKPGDKVEQGDVLAILENPEIEEKLQKVNVELKAQEVEIRTQRAVQNLAGEKLAIERRETYRKQKADLEKQMLQLTLLAPCKGRVVAPAREDEARLEERATKLPKWHGTPLNPRNHAAFLQPRTHLLSIAPDDDYQAVLLVDQADRNDIRAEDGSNEGKATRIRLMLDHLPHKVFEAKVSEISERPVEFAPPALSNKHGGDLATVSDSQGREKLESVAYQAIVVLDEDSWLMTTGQKGRAKFIVETRSAWAWTFRYLRRTFHFRL